MLRRAGRTASVYVNLGSLGGYWDSAGGSDVVPIQDNESAG
jgi:hypothetical protein